MRVNLGDLRSMVESGVVGTVLVEVFPDQQGRLVGKRVMGQQVPDVVARAPWRPATTCG